jgi:class 3 adenylate cyclase
MSAAMDILDAAVEQSVKERGGLIVRSRGEGDSHFVIFTRAVGAVRAAAALQQSLRGAAWPSGARLRVRVALHAGDVTKRGHDYAGIAINHTARLRSTSHGGQVVVSRAIVELTKTEIGAGLHFESLGRHRVRDLAGWTEVFQLCGPSLEREFPSLVTLDNGLPPITTIVLLDAVGMIRGIETSGSDERAPLVRHLVEVFATIFSACGGQHLKQMGDGCLALFADPDAAIAFARSARSEIRGLNISVRSAVHVGRVEFVHEEPVGRPLLVASALLRRAPADRIAVSRAAAALVSPADDVVLLEREAERLRGRRRSRRGLQRSP